MSGGGVLAEVVKVGYWFDPPSQWSDEVPVLREWHVRGGDFPGLDYTTGSLGGWSGRALREMAATFGSAVLNEHSDDTKGAP